MGTGNSPRALVCHEYGQQDGSEARFRIEPWTRHCRDDQVRIRTHAAAVNFADTLMVRGAYPLKPTPPFVPGHEVAGEVTEVGQAVRGFCKGDRVLSLCGVGGFAEEVVVTPGKQQLHRIPESMPWEEAAGFNLNFGTALHGLRKRGGLWAGETILVLGAASGTGSAAVQISKAMGATVLAAARGQVGCDFVHELGADRVIDLAEGKLAAQVQEFTRGRGVDVVFDPLGGEFFADAEHCLAWNGRYLVVGFAGAHIPSLPMDRAIHRGISVVGVSYAVSAIHDPARNADDFAWLFESYDRGSVRPRIDSVFPLDKAAVALRQVRDGSTNGKVIVETQR